ncbi:GntR family transcriptional regulator [Halogeometricum borinquense]|uniref:GntR family transcriptional regulator n=1 Tax=Halogeometricum borinquense TaxID=60847 RepID=A0A6C0UHI2_9EURY|nr:GntR family transcriptional regulator [Halogeometricum borinquense]QIB74667.1 GntR family transcriptional regulator [Halogeometricum borinquense]QIQ76380.1 GntR family transcriptional regulator [Halogeometricum borinquense]
MPGRDASDVLCLIERREAVLRRVGPVEQRKRDLSESLSVSRSTVDRAIRELVEAGFVERGEDGYVRTLSGRLVLEAFDQFANRAEDITNAGNIIDLIGSDSEFDIAVLDGADVVEATQTSPHRPLGHLASIIERADRIHAFAPAVFPSQVNTYHRRIVEEGVTARVLVAEKVMNRLVSTYRTKTQEALSTDRLEIRWTTDLPPYSLALGETDDGPELGLLTYADHGVGGFIGNDSPEAVEWGRRTLSRLWEDGEPIPMQSADD